MSSSCTENPSQSLSAIVLIGMPGAGKSTVGRLLAEKRQWPLVDTDDLLANDAGCSLQDIVDQQGYRRLRQIEEAVILKGDFTQQVVATGGSAVYSDKAMAHLRRFGPLVFLNVPLSELTSRLSNFALRGIAAEPGTGINEVFAQRMPLYRQWADVTIDCKDKDETAVCAAVLAALES
ncbi:shikimate kinase [Spongiibacter sp. IMCC21906]|uniref:shikimate kinase n=1 Tax=Spongiibacter sp. IMCC21906 TaxID=1620392 RepID=UPI00062DFE79|nr:shikimate kinase [Spongiibacter sp. IMCC21906]AKH70446.1 shikimate kinase [Spongiibacter sp. IMCC21906]